MSTIYTHLTTLQPIDLKYAYWRDENIQKEKISLQDGYTFYKINGLQHYQDISVNKNSCFILTSAVNIRQVFPQTETFYIGKLPGSVYLKPRNFTNQPSLYYFKHFDNINSFSVSLTGSLFYISPVLNTQEVEIIVDNNYLQIEENYPYKLYLSPESLDPEEINRQRFYINFYNKTITIRTKTKDGFRYIGLNQDNTLRATGVILGQTVVNDYVFECIPLTYESFSYGFNPSQSIVTYYFDAEYGSENTSVRINKKYDVPTSFLITFSPYEAAKSNSSVINIANLKNIMTPAGGPPPIENSYLKLPSYE
jgi:hypothetical protein